MKTTLFTLFFSVFFILHGSAFNSVAFTSVPVAKEITVEPNAKNKQKQSFKTIRQSLEKKLGRKLKLTERLGLWYNTQLPGYDNEYKRTANNHAVIGFILGVCSLVLFPLLAIPGFIFSNSALNKEGIDPGILEGGNKGLAKAGRILSIVGFLYLFLLVVYIVLILSIGLYGI